MCLVVLFPSLLLLFIYTYAARMYIHRWMVNPKKSETGLRTIRAGIADTLLLGVEAIGLPTLGLLLWMVCMQESAMEALSEILARTSARSTVVVHTVQRESSCSAVWLLVCIESMSLSDSGYLRRGLAPNIRGGWGYAFPLRGLRVQWYCVRNLVMLLWSWFGPACPPALS